MDSFSDSDSRSDKYHVEGIASPSVGNKLPFQHELSIPESLRILTDPRQDISTLSTLILPQLSPDTTERVFPIRSVVSKDSSAPSSAVQTPSLESSEWQISPFSETSWCFPNGGDTSNQPITPTTSDSASPTIRNEDLNGSWRQKDTETFSGTAQHSPNGARLSQANLQRHQQTNNGPKATQESQSQGAHRKVETVYSFGVLIVLRESEGRLAVQTSSKNTGDIIGHTPEELFGLGSFCDILPQDEGVGFLSRTKSIRDKCYNVEQQGPDVLDLTITASNGESRNFWCTLHENKENADYIVCEIEPQRTSTDSFGYHDGPISHAPTQHETGSNESGGSFPESFRVFRELRASKRGFEYSSILNAVSRIIQLTSTAQSIDELFNRVIGILKEITGFDKATVYRFDSDWNGIAVADLTDPQFWGETYEDMHFLGSVFSEDLQTLHQRNKVRLSYNHRDQLPTELTHREPNEESHLDTTFCYLSMGLPVPVELLSRTPVEACISIRINVFGKLWGLVSCTSYSKGARLLPPLQKLCWLISDTLSSNIERLSYTLPFQMVEQGSSPQEDGKRDAFPGVDILSLFGADYAASSIVGETKILGKPYDSQEVLALMEYLRMRELDTIVWSTDLNKDFPDMSYPAGFKYISALLFIPLSVDGRDFILFFRTSQWREITWAGCSKDDSHDRVDAERVQGKSNVLCRPDGWSAVDLGKASVLSLIYKTFTEVWQQKETAMQNTLLMKLLLANCAHEFRTPLNAIINYLEIALDGSLSQETRDNLSRSHSASKSLVYIINDLLDLTNAENGQCLIKDEVFNLSGTIREATHIFGEEAKQKNVDLHVVEHTDLPLVLGDQRRVRQVIMNLISNAVQHTSDGSVVIESCVPPDMTESDTIGVEVAIHDTGSGMSQEAVEALFCELEEVSNEDYIQNSQCCRTKVDDTTEESKNVLGLGLALVARIVRNMDGRLTLKSEQGTGSCFRIRLKFPLPSAGQETAILHQSGSRGEHGKDVHFGAIKENTQPSTGQTDTKDNNSQEQPGICEKDETKATKPICENGCSSQYGETPESRKHDNPNSNVNIDLSTESSELIHQSDKKPPYAQGRSQQSILEATKSSRSLTSPEPDAASKHLSKAVAAGSDQESSQKSTTIEVHEKSERQPSTVDQPLNEPTKTDAGATSRPTKLPAQSGLHVLVAEDDPINSTIVRKRLEKLGHTVHLTANGKECAAIYRQNAGSFDALLMDIQVSISFPGQDHSTTLTWLDAHCRRHRRYQDDTRVRRNNSNSSKSGSNKCGRRLQQPHPHIRSLCIVTGKGPTDVYRLRV